MRVVLVRLSALGDVVHAWPLAAAVRAVRPDVHLTWVVEAPLRPLVDGHPAVDAVLTTSTRRWRRRPWTPSTRREVGGLATHLRELAPDVVLDPQGTVKSAAVVRMTRAPRRVGLARPWRRELLAGLAYTEVVPGRRDHPHVVASNVELARLLGGAPPAAPPAPDGRWLLAGDAAPDPPAGGAYAVVLPGAGQRGKVLPTATLAQVCDGLSERGLRAVVAWGPGERHRAEAIASQAAFSAEVAPPTGLRELARLLGGATAVVGGDTGPVHLAASLGVPTVGVFLVTDWRRNGPLGARVAVVSGAVAVRGGPRGSAEARAVRTPSADEIVTAAAALLDDQ